MDTRCKRFSNRQIAVGPRPTAALWMSLALAVMPTSLSGQTAREVLERLEQRQMTPEERGLLLGCGPLRREAREAEDAVRRLVSLGADAQGELELVLDSVARDGLSSVHASILYVTAWAYAAIRGPAAFPRIAALANDPRLKDYRSTWDAALGRALGVTSLVSESRRDVPVLHCLPPKPSEILDELMIALWRGNSAAVLRVLHPSSTRSFRALQKTTAWKQAVGRPIGPGVWRYSMSNSGSWATEFWIPRDPHWFAKASDREYRVDFVGEAGTVCASETVSLVRGGLWLQVKVRDLVEFVGVLERCRNSTLTPPVDGGPR